MPYRGGGLWNPHDAAGLAQLPRTGFYKEVDAKSPAAHGVRSVLIARNHLVESRVRLENMIRGCALRSATVTDPGKRRPLSPAIMEAAHIPGLGEAIASLTRIKESFSLKTWVMKIAKRRGLKKARVALAQRRARSSCMPCCVMALCSRHKVR